MSSGNGRGGGIGVAASTDRGVGGEGEAGAGDDGLFAGGDGEGAGVGGVDGADAAGAGIARTGDTGTVTACDAGCGGGVVSCRDASQTTSVTALTHAIAFRRARTQANSRTAVCRDSSTEVVGGAGGG